MQSPGWIQTTGIVLAIALAVAAAACWREQRALIEAYEPVWSAPYERLDTLPEPKRAEFVLELLPRCCT